MNIFKEVADIKTSDQLHLPVPEAVFHNVVAKPTEIQKSMVQELSERALKVHAGTVDPSVDNMLRITSDGRKLGLDQRIINPIFRTTRRVRSISALRTSTIFGMMARLTS